MVPLCTPWPPRWSEDQPLALLYVLWQVAQVAGMELMCLMNVEEEMAGRGCVVLNSQAWPSCFLLVVEKRCCRFPNIR